MFALQRTARTIRERIEMGYLFILGMINMMSERRLSWLVFGVLLFSVTTMHAGVHTNRGTFEAAVSGGGWTPLTETFETAIPALAPTAQYVNGAGVFTFASTGFSYNSIQYVGHWDPQYTPQNNPLFPSEWETNLYNAPGSPYSLNGSTNFVLGRTDANINLPAGIVALGLDLAFDRGVNSSGLTSYNVPSITPTTDTM